jgi:hypothetical protein
MVTTSNVLLVEEMTIAAGRRQRLDDGALSPVS